MGSKGPAFFVTEMKATTLEQKLASLIRPVVEDLGFSLCWVKVSGEGGGQTVQVTAENPATRRLGIDDCTAVSRAVSVVLDVEDPINGAYMLEVSSPGIDRMLCRPQDYKDFAGFEAKVELDSPLNGQRRFRGIIKGIENDEDILLTGDTEDHRLSFHDVRKAKLVLTDDLIKATSQQDGTTKEER